ncbi:MAG: PaaI family thioesterase [Myxococcota bacterium]
MPAPQLPPLPDDIVARLNGNLGGFNELMGFRFTAISYERLEGQLPVAPKLHQPYGLVHGGVYAAVVETMASTAAALHGMAQNRRIVGLENATSFLRGTRDGTLKAVCTPLATGRRTHVWQVDITNDEGKVAASGKVRLLALEAEENVGGRKLEAKGG